MMYQLVVKSNIVSFGTLIVLDSFRTLSDHDQQTQHVACKIFT